MMFRRPVAAGRSRAGGDPHPDLLQNAARFRFDAAAVAGLPGRAAGRWGRPGGTGASGTSGVAVWDITE
ncbi:hypothetical protein [Streptomyces sp. TP-A0356]|uniref:hypothetical protein n=1 Tax=Streptomyces sp. TP-A0356 TaxID=1359208 RepID=UPI000ACBC136|nr:hypothetical protein [Streptomyces sp. TP-A0356]